MRGGTFQAVLVISTVAAGCGLAPPVAEPPAKCNFVDGTALIFSGRSTTQALGVTEVSGDPMRNDAADIYITRDEFDQGDLRGRLVCAIYPGEPGFVEVTVVPEGWQPPTGETAEVGSTADPSPPSSQPPTPHGSPIGPHGSPIGMSRNEAITDGRDAVPEAEEWDVVSAKAGPLAEVFPAMGEFDWSRDLPADRWIWIIFFVDGDQGAIVVLDYADGSVYDVMNAIVN